MINKKKTVWLTGRGLRLPEGNASTNRLCEVAKGFKSNGYDVKLIPLFKPKGKYSGVYNDVPFEFFKQLDIPDNGNILDRLNKNKFKNVQKKCLIEHGLNESVKIIFCSTASPDIILLLRSVSSELKIPLIYDVVEDPISTLKSKDFKEFSLKEWVQLILNVIQIPVIYKKSWRLPDYLCTISEELKSKLVNLRFNSSKIFVLPILKYITKDIPQQTDIESFQNTSNPFKIIHSGSTYFPKDGILEILNSIEILKSRGVIVHLEFYGPIRPTEVKRIEQLLIDKNLESQIRVIGRVELHELFEIQKSAGALICFKPLNKQNKYNFATKLIDYLDSGRPLILTDLPVYKNYFKDGENAFIVSEYSGLALADKIQFIINNPEIADEIGYRGKATLQNKFSAHELTKDLLELIGIPLN